MQCIQPYTVAKHKEINRGDSSSYKVIHGLDATGDEWQESKWTDTWKDGHVLTFWAYDYEYPGTSPFHVIEDTRYGPLQRIQIERDDTIADAVGTGWIHRFTFWAFDTSTGKK